MQTPLRTLLTNPIYLFNSRPTYAIAISLCRSIQISQPYTSCATIRICFSWIRRRTSGICTTFQAIRITRNAAVRQSLIKVNVIQKLAFRTTRITTIEKEYVTVEFSWNTWRKRISKHHLRVLSSNIIIILNYLCIHERNRGRIVLSQCIHDIICAWSECKRLIWDKITIERLIYLLKNCNNSISDIVAIVINVTDIDVLMITCRKFSNCKHKSIRRCHIEGRCVNKRKTHTIDLQFSIARITFH